jgi:hypothetical protein
MVSLRAPALVSVLLLSACSYGPPRWYRNVPSELEHPDQRKFVFVVDSTLRREPDNFVSQFPDGGAPIIVREEANFFFCDFDQRQCSKLADVPRPDEIKSAFEPFLHGWSLTPEGESVYFQLTGNRGETSDTEFMKLLYKMEISPRAGRFERVTSLPADLRRQASVPPVDLTFDVTDTNLEVDVSTGWPDYIPFLRVEEQSGDLVMLPQQ